MAHTKAIELWWSNVFLLLLWASYSVSLSFSRIYWLIMP
jgi:hypothetical protein